MIENKEALIYSLENSINQLENIINQSILENQPREKEIYLILGTALLWIGCCLDRLDEIGVSYSEGEKDYKQAFKGAYNAQKHSIKLIRFDGFTSGSRFPMRWDFRWGDGNYYFKELEEDIIENKGQILKYNKLLKDKEILEEIKRIEKIIKSKFGE